MTQAHRRTTAALSALLALPAVASACDVSAPLAQPIPAGPVLTATRTLAAASGCRIVLDPAVSDRTLPEGFAATATVADALDQIAIALALNWSARDGGDIALVDRHAAAPQTADALVISAMPDPRPTPDATTLARLPGERSPIIARTALGAARMADDALHDYQTAVARAPNVYGMAASDVIRGIGASRLAPNQRASLLTLDGIPLPAEAWLYNRPGLGLIQSIDITRSGTGLAVGYGSGAGDVAMHTREPDAEPSATLMLGDAIDRSPQVGATATGDFGVSGLRTAFGFSRQIGSEAPQRDGEPDVFRQRQAVARIQAGRDTDAPQVSASVIDFARADFGGGETACGGGQPHCVLGSDFALHGAAATTIWPLANGARVVALLGSSDLRVSVLRDGVDSIDLGPPAYVRMRHADLRVEHPVGEHGVLSGGILQARRDYRTYEPQRFVLGGLTSVQLGMVPAVPGLGSLSYRRAETARTDLPQVYGEWFYDDGERLEARIGLRRVFTAVASHVRADAVIAENCALVPGRFPGLTTCEEAFASLIHARNDRIRHDAALWLPDLGLRYRLDERDWIAVQARESYLGSDLDTLALSPDAGVERIRSHEVVWSHPVGGHGFAEWRVFHHDWRDRVANLNGSLPDAIRFDSRIVGAEAEIGGPIGERGEWWANAGLQRTHSNLDALPRDDVAVRGAPPWSLGLGGRYRWPGGAYVGGHFSHAAATWVVDDNAQVESLASRDLLDLRVGWRNDRVDVSLYGTNLLDDDYIADTYTLGTLLTPYHAYDRTIGVDAVVHWP